MVDDTSTKTFRMTLMIKCALACTVVAVHLFSASSISGQAPVEPALKAKFDQAKIIYSEAESLRKDGKAESLRASVLKYEEARKLFSETGSRTELGLCLNRAGTVQLSLANYREAIVLFNTSLELDKELRNRGNEAITIMNIGVAYSNIGDRQKALENYNTALKLVEESSDKSTKAILLNNIGAVYRSLGNTQKAIDAINQSLLIRKEIGDKGGIAQSLNNLGSIYEELGENKVALGLLRQALDVRRELGDKRAIASTLNIIGLTHHGVGDRVEALAAFNESLRLRREVGDRRGEAISLNNIGLVYNAFGEWQKAVEHFGQALTIRRQIADQPGEAVTLNNIGGVMEQLGETNRAIDNYGKALDIARKIGDKRLEATTLNNIGVAYEIKKEWKKSLEYYGSSLPLRKQVGDVRGEARTLTNLGIVQSGLGDKIKAIELFNQSIQLSEKTGDRAGLASALTNLGKATGELGERGKAMSYYFQALPLWRQIGERAGEAKTLDHLQQTAYEMGSRSVAIFFGKQSINRYQELRQAIGGLGRDTQRSYLKTVEGVYRRLANILTEEGRFFEAQQVLDLLKVAEFSEYVRRDSEEIRKLSARTDLTPTEKTALENYETLAGRVAEIGSRFLKLDELRKIQGEEFKQKDEFDSLKENLDTANAAFRIFLEKTLSSQLPSHVRRGIDSDRALQGRLAQWGDGTVALYTMVGEDRYRVILTTPKTQTDGKSEITAADLNRKIFQFRAALQNPTVDPRPLGKEIYDVLIKPIENDLAGAGAKTLLLSLDGTLRYFPIGALSPDGVHYLAEKYRTVVITSTIRQNLISDVERAWKVLGAGVTGESEVADPFDSGRLRFSPLPGVDGELRRIIRDEESGGPEHGSISGRRLIDGAFELKALERSMMQRNGIRPRYNVVHFATHFRLGADNTRSFLLLGNNKPLTLAEVNDNSSLDFTDVELVTLSACNTAFGMAANTAESNSNNGAEVDSLATFIEMRGAKAVMATLWPVADESTAMLMGEFYRLKNENPRMTKAEALIDAQRAMLTGKFKGSGNGPACRSDLLDSGGESHKLFRCDVKAPFSHPYYWSPFILIGNWR